MTSIVGLIMSTKTKAKLIIGALLLILISAFFLWPSTDVSVIEEEKLRTVELVPAGDLVTDTVVTSTLGTVQSLQDVSVRAETSGQVVNINITEGDTVVAGEIVMELERQSLEAQVLQARARLSSAQATLNKLLNGDRPEDIQIIEQKLIAEKERLKELKRGSRPEELAVTETALENAQKNLDDAERELVNVKEQTEKDSEAQLQKSVDSIQSTAIVIERLLSQNLQNIVYPSRIPKNRTCELQITTLLKSTIKPECFKILLVSEDQKVLSNQYQDLQDYEYTQVLMDLDLTKSRLQQLRDFFILALQATGGTISITPTGTPQASSITNVTLTELKTSITNGQTEIESIISQLTSQIEAQKKQSIINQSAIDNAESRLTQSQNTVNNTEKDLQLKEIGASDEQVAIQESQIQQLELQLKVAREGARPEDIQAQRASVQQAQADVAVATANRDKAVIRAPISGTVIQFSFDIGDYVSNGEEIMLMANQERLEVITFVTEEERRFIEKGSPVQLLDNLVNGTVARISPALDRDTKKIEVTITVDEGQEELVIGQTVFAGFELVMNKDSVRVPLETVKVLGNSAFVFTVDESSRVSVIPVTAGRIIGETIIISGIDRQKLLIPKVSNLEGGQEVVPLQKTQNDEVEQVYLSVPNTYPEILPQLSPVQS